MKRLRYFIFGFIILVMLVTACTPATPVVIKETVIVKEPVKETVVVKETVKETSVVKETVKETSVVKETVVVAPAHEAPMLAELVKAGKLPPLEERIPKDPCIGATDIPSDWIVPTIGKYGGTLRLVDYDAGSMGHDATWIEDEPLLHVQGLQYNNKKVVGNVLKGFDMNADATVFTYYLREGMKWSDGEPFTTDDIYFWYKNIMLNENLTPSWTDAGWRSGHDPKGDPAKLEVVDKYTFTVSFTKPYGSFNENMTRLSPYIPPAHFMKKFHADYTPLEQLEPIIKEKGFKPGEWVKLFNYMRDWTKQAETGIPTIRPFLITSRSDTLWTFERNPYYFKVDAAGNQLPYFDKMTATIVKDVEAATLKIIAGEVDLANRPVNAKSLPLYKQYGDQKGYVISLLPQHASLAELFFNLTNTDPGWREIVGDVRFRQAVSYAINRKQIVDALYYGLAGTPHVIPADWSYNPDKANQILDEIGMEKKDADGCRLGPDGKAFIIPFEWGESTGESIPTGEMVQADLKKVGICSTAKTLEWNLFWTTGLANGLHAFTFWAHYPHWPYYGLNEYIGWSGMTTWGPLWYDWYTTGGEKGEKPPEWYTFLTSTRDAMLTTPDTNQMETMWSQIRQKMADNLIIISIVDDVLNPTILNKNIRNFPTKGVAIEAKTSGEQMYFDQ